MKIRCLIADDEPLSQDVLRKYIDDTPMLELVQCCNDSFEANDAIQSDNIELIFLDINMPGLSGISFLKALSNPPLVIFTTAYPEYAVEGFETDAVDYLVKPFPYERFLKAVNKAAEKISMTGMRKNPAEDFIVLRSDRKVYKVNYTDIVYLQSYGDYIKVFITDRCLVIHDTFRNMEERLPGDRFIRVHKSYIISLEKVQYIEGNQVKVGEEMIPIGLNYKDKLFSLFKQE